MIDIRKIRFDGQLNHQNGLYFYFSGHHHIISFLVKSIDYRKKYIRITMQPDLNHERPHVHIDEHGASFAIDTGELLAGECDNRTRRLMERWILKHRHDLVQLWDIAKAGGEYRALVERIRHDKGFEEYGFNGKEPSHKTIVDGAIIWHDSELTREKVSETTIHYSCDGDLYVCLPKGKEERMVFESRNGGRVVKKKL